MPKTLSGLNTFAKHFLRVFLVICLWQNESNTKGAIVLKQLSRRYLILILVLSTIELKAKSAVGKSSSVSFLVAKYTKGSIFRDWPETKMKKKIKFVQI